MTTLHDRLADLAEEVPRTLPPPDLWRTGKRRARRGRLASIGAVVAVAAIVGLGNSALVAHLQSDAPVVESPSRTVLPDRFYEPGR